VRAIIDRVRLRADVLGRQGFARKLGKGLGLTVLLSGEPGTGKSMVAGLVARQLGLDLYVIDLARVTSKWLGETEKNLARAFDAAEVGHVLLLFDEADSVLARRSSVESSNDRHANLETNFILARLEQFGGIAFFTTNLASSIDPAVARRMSMHITFPFPDRDQRAQLWQSMIPHGVACEPGIDFDDLAERYNVSGGFIRNIVLRAAFVAARDRRALAMADLRDAADSEYRERGMIARGGRLA
jgi:SpoVK/Ycf46/Vps4 family AAA+-type ATPase